MLSICRYAHQVAEFFEFVKKKKEDASELSTKDAPGKAHPKIMLPNQGGFWTPGGQNFPESALKSLDFQRAMSLMSTQ